MEKLEEHGELHDDNCSDFQEDGCDCTMHGLKDLFKEARQEVKDQCIKIVEDNKLPYPNAYGHSVQVKRVNDNILDKIKEEIIEKVQA